MQRALTKNVLKSIATSRFGQWVDVCNGRYLFGNQIVLFLSTNYKFGKTEKFQATWEQNVLKCCSLDMDPIIFNSAEEQSCLSNYTKSKIYFLITYF
jgi:hypothetical protein